VCVSVCTPPPHIVGRQRLSKHVPLGNDYTRSSRIVERVVFYVVRLISLAFIAHASTGTLGLLFSAWTDIGLIHYREVPTHNVMI
jgi:hypothetical protein